MPHIEDLAWRAEEACLDAWPSPCQHTPDGWLLRAWGGPTPRTNALDPLRGPRGPEGSAIFAYARIYAGLGRPATDGPSPR